MEFGGAAVRRACRTGQGKATFGLAFQRFKQPMYEISGTMQTNGQSNSARTDQSRRGPRFTLPSGAKPLDGYTIKRGVGVGGFGEVYYATSDAGKEVALKRIQRNLDIELRGVRQCLNIKHANLVALFDIKYDDEDQAWVVMEYVSGESLQDVIERNPNGMPLDEVHKWFDGITAGVSHLHDCGIVHRDLKPGNIFIDGQTVKIGDYGLSKFISCSRRSGQTQSVGTFHYMAPEIGQGRYGKEIDIYAVGIMLYEMLTGRVPYDGESSQEIIMKHLTAEPSLTGLASPYREVIAEALAKDPAARCQSVSEMRERVLGGSTSSSARAYVAAAAVGRRVPPPPDPRVSNEPLPNEPIAEAVKTAWSDLSEAWKTSDLGNTTRLLIILAAVLLLIFNSRWLLPYGASIIVSYGVYVLIRGMVLRRTPGRTAFRRGDSALAVTQAARPSDAAEEIIFAETVESPVLAEPIPGTRPKRMPRHMRRLRRRAVAEQQRWLRQSLAAKASRNKWSELTGSMLLAAVVCLVVGLIGFILRGIDQPSSDASLVAHFTWVAMTSTFAAWGVLFISKWWEGKEGETMSRRFALLLAGLVVGGGSWALANYLAIRPEYMMGPLEGLGLESAPNALYDGYNAPKVLAYLAYFGFLFGILRWWRQADPLRSTRLGIWRTAFCLLGALVVQVFFPFPGGFLIPITTAIAVQLSAPYWDRVERKQFVEQVELGGQP